MGLPSTIFTKEFQLSGVEGLQGSQIEYLTSVESGHTISFQVHKKYTGTIFEIASGSNYVRIVQAGTQFTLQTETGSIAGSESNLAWTITITSYDTVSHLYINNTYIGSAAKVSSSYTDLTVNGYLAWLKIYYNSTATQNKILDGFVEYLPEHYYWAFDGVELGYTRCDVTKFVSQYALQKSTEDLQSGSEVSNKLSMDLLNETDDPYSKYNGVWSDDQIQSSYDPSIAFYNGTARQQYLQDRFRVWLEYWHGSNFEPQFTGRVSNNLINRQKSTNSAGRASITAEDWVERLATTQITDGYILEDLALIDSVTVANSILHQHIDRVKGTTSAIAYTPSTDGTPTAGGPFGETYTAGATLTTYTATTLEKSRGYVISFWVRGSGSIIFPDASIETFNNTDWRRLDYKYKKPGTGSDIFTLSGSYDIYSFNISSTGNNLYKNAVQEYAWFKTIVDDISYVHPWIFIQESDNIWDNLKDISVASAGVNMGFDEYGRFIFQSGFVDRYPVRTITTASSIAAKIDGTTINRLKVKGIFVAKDDQDHVVWNSMSAGFNEEEKLVLFGDSWPDPEIYGDEYVATYKGIDT